MGDGTPAEVGVEHEDAASAEKPVRRRRRKEINWHEKVRVKNLTPRKIHTPTGTVLPHQDGEMSRIDAERMHNYVEILDG